MSFHNRLIFFWCPSIFLYIRIQMIMPSNTFSIHTQNSFIYLSLHCFPILPGRCLAISLQFFAPFFLTISITILSSVGVHGPLMRLGFSTFCHLCKHCTSVRSFIYEATFFQFLAPCFSTTFLNNSSYKNTRK